MLQALLKPKIQDIKLPQAEAKGIVKAKITDIELLKATTKHNNNT